MMKNYLKAVSVSLFLCAHIYSAERTPPAGKRRLPLNNPQEVALRNLDELRIAVDKRNQAAAGSDFAKEQERICLELAFLAQIDAALNVKAKRQINQALQKRG